ncbi:UDP-N-acetylglucosamine 2-epimerase [Streptomyces viridifaciens]|nr:glycosyltransferase [Streptomyces viridifaciens]UKZ08072.1 UDP-N-acetylglucosamine 2-epimerase [Streptomyces viridifaciens]
MPDALHDRIVLHQDAVVWFAGLISLALVGYMAFVFGRFLVYWAGSRHAFRHNRPAEPGDPSAFQWHLVIPCRDEEAVVTQTLDGLRAAAPEAHLWVIDDDSEDATRELVLAAAARDPRVHLVQRRRPHARIGKGAALLAAHGLRPDGYVLATVHRPENTDTAEALGAVLAELDRIARAGTPVLFPMHPRTRAAVERFGLAGLLERLAVTEPVGYGDFLGLANHAALLVSDSGGVQEECTVLGRPLLVVRRSTERPEAMEAGFAALVQPGEELGGLARAWLSDTPERLARLAATPSPYGDGLASARIAALTAALAGRGAEPVVPLAAAAVRAAGRGGQTPARASGTCAVPPCRRRNSAVISASSPSGSSGSIIATPCSRPPSR